MVVDREASEEVEITSGVPQGSVLESIFFLIYINDMAEYTKHSQVRLLSDDTTIYLTLTAENDWWEDDWLMECHPDKYSVIKITRKKTIGRYSYTLHGQILAEETNTKYLRVTIEDKMMWNTNTEQTASTRNKSLGFLKRNLKINNPDIKSHAYKTLVRQTLKHCSMVWDLHTAIN